jgi:uncharacterized ferritin-like protein (DUF455 family)
LINSHFCLEWVREIDLALYDAAFHISAFLAFFMTSVSSIAPPFESIRRHSLRALQCCQPEEKVHIVYDLYRRVCEVDDVVIGAEESITLTAAVFAQLPGRPARPLLCDPRKVPQRLVHTLEGRAALLHAITHIEFNAINLALDAVWRFEGLPPKFYRDWLRVAYEEAQHFSMLVERLSSVNAQYGDFDAHHGLWDMADKTAEDVLARMALVPRTLEARGLDVSPAIREKFLQIGDKESAAALTVILEEEIGHVAIGNAWFNYLCQAQGFSPDVMYKTLASRYDAPRLRGPFNLAARRQAGFTEEELIALQSDFV